MARVPVQLGAIEVFAEAGRLGSFKRAAEGLSYTTSAVSQAIRKLEQRLGCELFERSGNRVHLTSAGKLLLSHVEHGLAQIRRGVDLVRSQGIGPLTLSSPPGIASQLLPPVIAALMGMDTLDVRIVADEQPDFRSYQQHDVAILYGEDAAQHHDLEAIGPDVFAPVCRPELAARITSSEQVLGHVLLVNETNAVSWGDWLKLNGVDRPIPRQLRYNRASHVIPALLDGLGIGLESMRLLSPQLASGALMLCDIAGARPIARDLTFLHVTQDPLRQARAQRVAALVRASCRTMDNGRLQAASSVA